MLLCRALVTTMLASLCRNGLTCGWKEVLLGCRVLSYLQVLKLPSRHRAGANIPDPTLFNNIVQGSHNLFWRRPAIETVNLQYIDVRAKSLDASLDRIKDVLPRQPDTVHELIVVDRNGVDGGLLRGIV